MSRHMKTARLALAKMYKRGWGKKKLEKALRKKTSYSAASMPSMYGFHRNRTDRD